jgi:hypothetical protein
MSKSRSYCFTINNYSEQEKAFVATLKDKNAKYVICGQEVTKTGVPHLQGYVSFKSPRTMSAVKKLLGGRAHLEIAKGSAEQNKKYCTKEGTGIYEYGKMPRQGNRTDMVVYREAVVNGATEKELMTNDKTLKVWASYPKLRNRIKQAAREGQTRSKVDVYIFYGSSNTGKSFYAQNTDPTAYWKEANKWWDGYDGEETIIMDEFNGSWFPFDSWKRILDHYPYRGEFKGGTIVARWNKVFIISNVHPSGWYAEGKWNKLETQRRVTAIYRMDSDGVCHFEESERSKDTLSTDVLELDGVTLKDIDWAAKQADDIEENKPTDGSDDEDEGDRSEEDNMSVSGSDQDDGIDIQDTDDESD